MCGIVGIVSWRAPLPAIDRLRKATNLLRHRGPDAGGYWCEGPAFLGHRRLAIIDLETGAQPMVSADGRYVITYNGEIYNYVELKQELHGRGHSFRTSSDTEAILAGYAEWGPDVSARLVGMFALAISDRKAQTLYLARDRFGEKPLLLAPGPDGVVFASELAPVTTLLPGAREIEESALAAYLCLNYVPGHRTLLRGVERLAPAEWRCYGASGLLERRTYWQPPVRPVPPTAANEAEIVDALQDRLDRAIAITLRSDVPVGLFLSGGIDSSVVAESAARQGRLKTAFCLDMEDEGFSEWRRASHVAARVGVDLVRVPFSDLVLDEFVEIAAHADEPLADSSATAVWTVARAAAGQVKVVLSGDGGDELFGGYLTYRASALHAQLATVLGSGARRMLSHAAGWVPVDGRRKVSSGEKLQRFLRGLPLSTAEAHFSWNGTWLPRDAGQLMAHAGTAAADRALGLLADAHAIPARPDIHDLQRADLLEYLPNDILAKVDRMAMAHGLESRAPLLNPEVAEFALALPLSARTGWRRASKPILRQLAARHFGTLHANAPKQGFSIPIHRWLRGRGRSLVTGILDPARVAAIGVLNPAAVAAAADAHFSGRRLLGWELWGLMVLVLWHEKHIALQPARWQPLADDDDLERVA